ncbi:MAG: DUF2723 domain-containing protein [Saprospiraceae bacterium]|nr:DUF2723 domain-containing protein [Saprospiraceae bacterium]
MNANKLITNIAGWLVFVIATAVLGYSVEPTGSLWDCGEFILGAYKLQVVHPPGAPLFALIGRMFTWVADIFSDNPEDIAFSVNLMSALCTAFAAAMICWVTIMLGKLALVGREEEMDKGQTIAVSGAGVVAGLSTAFTASIWFSAVEGEVYAMSTFFTTLTLWGMIKWYSLPDTPQSDRWLLFTVYAAGLSTGVHLLSILTFPALALFYYFKKYKNITFLGMAVAAAIGVVIIGLIQKLIIVGIPMLWGELELMTVNSLGLPFHSGLIPTLIIVAAIIAIPLLYVHDVFKSKTPLYILGGLATVFFLMSFGSNEDLTVSSRSTRFIIAALIFGIAALSEKHKPLLQLAFLATTLVIISFSTIGVVVVRANVDTPINMNAPDDALRLIPYLNREQYGERALLRGPHFEAQPVKSEITERYGRVGDRYEYTDYKISYEYDEADKMLFPRMGDYSQNRGQLYKQWMGLDPNKPLPAGRPNQADNISFMVRYQLGWMYWRYFMWNFAGRQNGDQGFYPWDKSSGHWVSGIKFLDEARLYNMNELPDVKKNDKAYNKYYMLPFLFGLVGLFFHFNRRRNDALGLLALFVITGIGIIIYSNQPPNEPRERDYVLAGSFFTFCIWIGMAVLAIFELVRTRLKLNGIIPAAIATVIVLIAPILMATQNYDDQSRRNHTGARDYATNFLESCAPNAIIFTYGDNDTYPLWYAQEVEGIRTDVRVVNLSLIAVDWYIDLLRRKVNDSPAIKMSISSNVLRGSKRNQVLYVDGDQNPNTPDPAVSIQDFLKFIAEDHPVPLQSGRSTDSYYYSKNVFIPVDRAKLLAEGAITLADSANVPDRMPLDITANDYYLLKDDIAVLDIIASNMFERPVYFAVTCRPDKLYGLQDFMKLEGLALRLTPIRSQGDPTFGIIGSGRVDTEAVYNNVMNKFRWGNFDKYEMYVDRSYTPSVQSIQTLILRGAATLIQEGDTTKAVQLTDKYFEAFPHKNFPYDYRTMYILNAYFQAGAYEKAKPHLAILADQLEQFLRFYESLDPDTIDSSFRQDYGLAYQTMETMLQRVKNAGDNEFLQELQNKFAPYQLNQTQPESIPPPPNQ